VASNVELGWCAGFFDGEGTTSVLKAQRDKYSYIRMGISQKDRRCLDRFQIAVGCGNIYKSNTREIYSWNCYKKDDVENVLLLLWPYLSNLKKEQAVRSRETVALNSKLKHDKLTEN
jgi:hypothetical protein